MAIGVGINGVLGGGGGVPSLADPSSFADAIALYRSDAGITLVGTQVDAWADQSGNGYDASAVTSGNRVEQVHNNGSYEFKDVLWRGNNSFRNTSFKATGYTELTVDFALRPTDQGTWFAIGRPTDTNACFYLFFAATNILIYTKNGGSLVYHYYAHGGLQKTCLCTITYDGSLSGTGRTSLYIDGVSVALGGNSGVFPASINAPTTAEFNIPTWTGTSKGILGYVGIWDRALTGDEIAANQTWKESVWS